MRGRTRFRLSGFSLEGPGYQDVLRLLTGQSRYLKPDRGTRPSLRWAPLPGPPHNLPYATLFKGREGLSPEPEALKERLATLGSESGRPARGELRAGRPSSRQPHPVNKPCLQPA